ncbi:MAG: carbon monoxide dehydrogenase beta subunit family protein [Methanoregula sp.]|jgi:acetyl-CoA decarbonylase/synthase complex subunit epsilon
MSTTEPWQTAETGGTKQAVVIQKPEVIAALLRNAHHPILIIGHLAAEMEAGTRTYGELLIDLAQTRNLPVIATGHANRDLVHRGFTRATILPAVEAGQRICDPGWKGPDGKGTVDLVLVAGLPYPMAWTLLSGLRNFAPQVKTVSLDPLYHPNAGLSFGNIPLNVWTESLVFLVQAKNTER